MKCRFENKQCIIYLEVTNFPNIQLLQVEILPKSFGMKKDFFTRAYGKNDSRAWQDFSIIRARLTNLFGYSVVF